MMSLPRPERAKTRMRLYIWTDNRGMRQPVVKAESLTLQEGGALIFSNGFGTSDDALVLMLASGQWQQVVEITS